METPDRTIDLVRFWFTLALTPGIGRALVRALIDEPETPRDLHALADRLAPQNAGLACALIAPPDALRAALEASLVWSLGNDCHLITIDHPHYPALLRQIADPPPVLHVHGQRDALTTPALAIVGSRNATLDGLRFARSIGAELAREGLAIASGLAAGIDHAAHLGALDAPGVSLAVLGTGINECYPSTHRATAARIAERGAVISELPIGSPALPHHFPRRNRIIAGLSLGILVVQAARRSGSLITARLGIEYGRDVMAIPGPIQSPLHKGCHQLLREGAALVESSEDVWAAIGSTWLGRRADRAGVPGPAQQGRESTAGRAPSGAEPCAHPGWLLLEPWGWCPFEPEAFAAQAGLTAGQSAQILIELELDGAIERLADGRLQRVDR
jgi:DNA processing protein